MLSYSDIVKKAYHITFSYPLLWLFGLFVVGGFNLNFLRYENIPLRHLLMRKEFLQTVSFFQDHPAILALASFFLLVLTLAGLAISNWSRIMLILSGESVLKTRVVDLKKQAVLSKASFLTVIQISLMTTTLIFFVGLALFLPPWLLDLGSSFRTILFAAATIVFLTLVFTISCINIFTTFYAVIYRKSLAVALNLGTDLFASRWTQILGLVFVLIVIYLGAFVIGIALITLARFLFATLFLLLLRFNILSFSAIIMILKFISNLLMWFLLAGLSVFFNQALLLLFFELNKPIESLQSLKERQPMPATSM